MNHRLLVVDDSVVIRAVMEKVFEADRDVSIVGLARNADEAVASIERLFPDVLTLDLSMPGMDSFAFLERLMSTKPLPVIVVSSSATLGNATAQRAIGLGASTCFDKTKILSDASEFRRVVKRAKRGTIDLGHATA